MKLLGHLIWHHGDIQRGGGESDLDLTRGVRGDVRGMRVRKIEARGMYAIRGMHAGCA